MEMQPGGRISVRF